MKTHANALITLIAILISTTVLAASEDRGSSIQILLGAVRYDNLEFDDGSGNSKTIDVSTMPQFGCVWSTAPKGEKLQFGLECSFLMGFNYDSASYDPVGGANSRVRVDYNIWMFDLAGGLYASLFMGKEDKVRIYAAGGPLLMYSGLYVYTYQDRPVGDDEFYFNKEHAFGYGLYARAGVDFRIHEKGLLGVGVRGTWSELDLSNVSDFAGISAFVTYTVQL